MSLRNIYSYFQSIPSYDFSSVCKEIASDDFVFENGLKDLEKLPLLEGNLGNYVFQVLAKHPLKIVLTDYTTDKPKVIRASVLLALSLLLAKKIRKHIGERRVGIALPAGVGSHIANLALLFANKTPVNLNFTLGRSAIESAIEQAGIKTVISTNTLLEKFAQFPWPRNGPEIAIMSKTNKKKGESLVLLSEKEIDMQALREKLLQAGISALWIPREYILVDDIPTLATGKLDLGACKQILEAKLLG